MFFVFFLELNEIRKPSSKFISKAILIFGGGEIVMGDKNMEKRYIGQELLPWTGILQGRG